jgi:hypothetical protein
MSCDSCVNGVCVLARVKCAPEAGWEAKPIPFRTAKPRSQQQDDHPLVRRVQSCERFRNKPDSQMECSD